MICRIKHLFSKKDVLLFYNFLGFDFNKNKENLKL